MNGSGMAFSVMFGCLMTHEIDALQRHEWRLLPVLRSLSDRAGRQMFVLLHVPLLAALIYVLIFPGPVAVAWTRAGLAVFAILHCGLHWMFRNHPDNEFNNPMSQLLIWGGGLAGVVFLMTGLT